MADVDDEPLNPDALENALAKIRGVIDETVRELCEKYHDSLIQEHQFTSRLLEAIERELKRLEIDGVDLQVDARDFPDKGPGALEKKTGADAYISVVRTDGHEKISKGILVQSKWRKGLRRTSEQQRLADQVSDMIERTSEAYVWVYGPEGIQVRRTNMAQVLRRRPDYQTVGELISEGLRCNAGDINIGRNLDLPLKQSLDAVMEKMGTEQFLEIKMGNNAKRYDVR